MRNNRNAEPFAEKYPRLVAEVEVEECLAQGERLTQLVRDPLLKVPTDE